MPNIQQTIQEINGRLPQTTRLVAVSKYHPIPALEEAYAAGQRIFGESHVQELVQKEAALPKDIQWHFIGHLQTNKIKYIAPFVSLIHAVDTPKLLKEINKHGERCNRAIPCLLQIHIAQEETKYGFSMAECREFLLAGEWAALPHVQICGLMCMASNTDDMEQVRQEFRSVHQFFMEMQRELQAELPCFQELSMGMSNDYPIAIQEGSTLIRVGSLIFGNRIY